jgi:hypothetical protein
LYVPATKRIEKNNKKISQIKSLNTKPSGHSHIRVDVSVNLTSQHNNSNNNQPAAKLIAKFENKIK